VETTVIGLAEQGVRSSVVRLATIAHSTTDRAGFLPRLIALAKGLHRLPFGESQ
jgi:hypothetical protein